MGVQFKHSAPPAQRLTKPNVNVNPMIITNGKLRIEVPLSTCDLQPEPELEISENSDIDEPEVCSKLNFFKLNF